MSSGDSLNAPSTTVNDGPVAEVEVASDGKVVLEAMSGEIVRRYQGTYLDGSCYNCPDIGLWHHARVL